MCLKGSCPCIEAYKVLITQASIMNNMSTQKNNVRTLVIDHFNPHNKLSINFYSFFAPRHITTLVKSCVDKPLRQLNQFSVMMIAVISCYKQPHAGSFNLQLIRSQKLGNSSSIGMKDTLFADNVIGSVLIKRVFELEAIC